jgi:hypothetical protein
MAQHGIDGAFLQRFATQCEVDGNSTGATADLMRLRDEVLDGVRAAAERENRVWAIMYDVTGVPPDHIEHVLRVDWDHLVRDKRILDSPYYLKERGMPVIAIWGFGFVEARHDPSIVARIARHLKSVTPGGAYLWAGGELYRFFFYFYEIITYSFLYSTVSVEDPVRRHGSQSSLFGCI